MANNKKISYFARDYVSIRDELYSLIGREYPNMLSDFNDTSVGSMFVDLLAAVSDDLSFHTDRVFQETLIDYAQERESLYALARTYGIKIPNKRPSVTSVEFIVDVPVDGDTFSNDYLPLIRRGAQVSGAGVIFETLHDIDFASPFSIAGTPNRVTIPNFDDNENIVSYSISKRVGVIQGSTSIYQEQITENNIKPFFEIILPDTDVISIENIIELDGINRISGPTTEDFMNFNNMWFEVDSLSQQNIFMEDTSKTNGDNGIPYGRWMRVTRKFVTEYTDNSYIKILFGSGASEANNQFNSQFINNIGGVLNNLSLGEIPKTNTTLYIRYRTGGGSNTNLGPDTITRIDFADIVVNGSDPQINLQVKNSLIVSHDTPAIGGLDRPTIEEIRNMIKFNFQSQNRAVTIKDYYSKISNLPGRFGAPYRFNVWEAENKIVISVLNLNSEGKLTTELTNTMSENIAEYLSEYRMINDYIMVDSGKIINLSVEVDIFRDKNFNSSDIISNTIDAVNNYFNINKWQMGDNIYVGNLVEVINNIAGVLNVVDVRFFNKVFGAYSNNTTIMPLSDSSTRQIELIDYTLYCDKDSIFEIKYPEKDIIIRIK